MMRMHAVMLMGTKQRAKKNGSASLHEIMAIRGHREGVNNKSLTEHSQIKITA